MIDLNQSSHSHDSLEIVHRNNFSCVRKIFRSDLNRAERNVAKQRSFRPLYTGGARISAADVLEFTVHHDHAELLMPYIEGMSGDTFPIHASRQVAHSLSAALSVLLYTQINDSCEKPVETTLFVEKLHGIIKTTRDVDLREILLHIFECLERLPEKIVFPVGPCHGDLTLSNIILDPSRGITLIDFLDTYLESPLQDVAKLKQDFEYGWSFRKDQSALRIKAKILCQNYFPPAIVQIERLYSVQVRLLTLMTLARIAPYVRDAHTKKWLQNSLTHCLKIPLI